MERRHADSLERIEAEGRKKMARMRRQGQGVIGRRFRALSKAGKKRDSEDDRSVS